MCEVLPQTGSLASTTTTGLRARTPNARALEGRNKNTVDFRTSSEAFLCRHDAKPNVVSYGPLQT